MNAANLQILPLVPPLVPPLDRIDLALSSLGWDNRRLNLMLLSGVSLCPISRAFKVTMYAI